VQLVSAYMPEPFGTHHTKMMVLLRHDDIAQVVIHTANMIPKDWRTMSQAIWRSPLLTLLPEGRPPAMGSEDIAPPIGTGPRFKVDLLRYLNAYGGRTKALTDQLSKYDFTPIRAAFIASSPSRFRECDADPSSHTSWGWLGFREILKTVDYARPAPNEPATIVTQISSIATLGQSDKWLSAFQNVLETTASPRDKGTPKAVHRIVFPTAGEIRASLAGYESGGSIHIKLQSAAQQKQLQYLRPYLCHWTSGQGDTTDNATVSATEGARRTTYRSTAAPHVKTYIRFSAGSAMKTLDWAMITSANMSTQAWGTTPDKDGTIRICSWEVGVVIWPRLWADEESELRHGELNDIKAGKGHEAGKTVMIPTFECDTPDPTNAVEARSTKHRQVIGFRMPYDLPLHRYSANEIPWCATAQHAEPDRFGRVWLD
jgi:tyrosyl-DNA phosphodiesterase 1